MLIHVELHRITTSLDSQTYSDHSDVSGRLLFECSPLNDLHSTRVVSEMLFPVQSVAHAVFFAHVLVS